MTLQEIDSDRKYVVHHDRLLNPLLSGNEFALRELEANANPQENEQDPEKDFEPVVNPEEALIHTPSGRTVKSAKKKILNTTSCSLARMYCLPRFHHP